MDIRYVLKAIELSVSMASTTTIHNNKIVATNVVLMLKGFTIKSEKRYI